MFNVIDQYNSFVENNFIKKNKDQIEFLKQADNVWSSFSKTKLFFKEKIFEGIYLYGQVGAGKTFLLNLFYQNTKIGKKIHFNNLMNEIHEQWKLRDTLLVLIFCFSDIQDLVVLENDENVLSVLKLAINQLLRASEN